MHVLQACCDIRRSTHPGLPPPTRLFHNASEQTVARSFKSIMLLNFTNGFILSMCVLLCAKGATSCRVDQFLFLRTLVTSDIQRCRMWHPSCTKHLPCTKHPPVLHRASSAALLLPCKLYTSDSFKYATECTIAASTSTPQFIWIPPDNPIVRHLPWHLSPTRWEPQARPHLQQYRSS